MKIGIKKAEISHAQRIYELLCCISRLHNNGRPDIFKGSESKYSLSDVLKLISSDEYSIRVAVTDDGYVVGYMICTVVMPSLNPHLVSRRALYVDDIYVDDNYRACGIGTALIEEAKIIGKENACDIIDLNVWSFNTSAIAFYEKLGMKESRRHMEMKL